MKRAVLCETSAGKIGIAEENGAVTNVFFGHTVTPQEFCLEETPLLTRAKRQLAEYFAGTRREFELPLALEGTEFERSVWNALLTIPYGETCTYGQIAARLSRPGASRAVGHANGRNPISIFVPCHRVIGANGKLTGYAGGLEMKTFLLRLEGAL